MALCRTRLAASALAVVVAAVFAGPGATKPKPRAAVTYAVTLTARITVAVDIDATTVDETGCRVRVTGGSSRRFDLRTPRAARVVVRAALPVRGAVRAVATRRLDYVTGYSTPECAGRPPVHWDPPAPTVRPAGRLAVRLASTRAGVITLSTAATSPLAEPFEACGRQLAVPGLEAAPGRLALARLRAGSRRVVSSGRSERTTPVEEADGCTLTARAEWKLVLTRVAGATTAAASRPTKPQIEAQTRVAVRSTRASLVALRVVAPNRRFVLRVRAADPARYLKYRVHRLVAVVNRLTNRLWVFRSRTFVVEDRAGGIVFSVAQTRAGGRAGTTWSVRPALEACAENIQFDGVEINPEGSAPRCPA